MIRVVVGKGRKEANTDQIYKIRNHTAIDHENFGHLRTECHSLLLSALGYSAWVFEKKLEHTYQMKI